MKNRRHAGVIVSKPTILCLVDERFNGVLSIASLRMLSQMLREPNGNP